MSKSEVWECPVCGVRVVTALPAAEVQTSKHKKYKCRGKMKKVSD